MAKRKVTAPDGPVTLPVTAPPPVGPKVRFEVFKRDKFTCQYCGRGAPEVVLNCDHINPVAAGGDSGILNLITSCRACNGGKGAVPLADASALTKQKVMLGELEDRRQQLEMLLAWRDGLQDLKQESLDALARAVTRGAIRPNELGRSKLQKLLHKYPLAELLQAVDEAFDTYFPEGGSNTEWVKAFSKIAVFADIARKEADRPYIRRLFYIQAILRNRTGWTQMLPFLEHCVLAGADVDDMESRARRTDHITHFTGPYEDWLASRGRPFGRRPY